MAVYKTLMNRNLVKIFNLGERIKRFSRNEDIDSSFLTKVYSPMKAKSNRIRHGSYRKFKT